MSSRATPGGSGEPDGTTAGASEGVASGAGLTVNEQSEELSLDQIFSVLKNHRRRYVFHYLREQNNPATLGEMAEHIAALENDCSREALSARERKRVYVGLYQCHLPRMKEFDIIDFDKDRGTLELGPNAALLEGYLEGTSEEGPPWPLYYLGLTGASLVAVAVVGVAGLLSPLGVVIPLVMLTALSGLSALHFVHEEDIDLPWRDREN